jgi:hypothetical protein
MVAFAEESGAAAGESPAVVQAEDPAKEAGMAVRQGEKVRRDATARPVAQPDLKEGGPAAKLPTSPTSGRFPREIALLFLAGMVLVGVFGLARKSVSS